MKLNLCCGTNIFPGWVNVDRTDLERDYLRHLREAPPGFVWPPAQQVHADALRRGEIDVRRWDIGSFLIGLVADGKGGTVDAIYNGQAIEHFNRRTQAPWLLRECARVLKPGGAIRLTTPDLYVIAMAWLNGETDRFISEQPDFYMNADYDDDRFAYLLFGASGDNCTRDNYEGHFHCYTPRSLGALLRECGLEPCTETGLFADCVDMGMSHSFAIEAVKR